MIIHGSWLRIVDVRLDLRAVSMVWVAEVRVVLDAVVVRLDVRVSKAGVAKKMVLERRGQNRGNGG